MAGIGAAALVGLLSGWREGGPAQRQLAATIRALVLDGRVPLESRLPAERELAEALGVSRSTVTAAYNQLRHDGYLASRQGAGSWVAIPGGHRARRPRTLPNWRSTPRTVPSSSSGTMCSNLPEVCSISPF